MENSKKNQVTENRILDILIDAKQSMDSNSFSREDFVKKYKSTVGAVFSVLNKMDMIYKLDGRYYWKGHSPDISLAIEIKNIYVEKNRISQKNSHQRRINFLKSIKNKQSIENAEKEVNNELEEVVLDPLNFEVPLNAFQDVEKTTIHPHLMPIEDYQKLQIDSYIRQTSNLQSEIEKLKSIIDRKDETISARQEEYNELLSKASTFTKRVRNLESELNINKQKRAIRLFGIKIGSIG
jgi:predicted RNase H-like nuclease (RuvC/YqgF family)